MHFGPTEEQTEFIRAVREFCSRRSPEAQLIDRIDRGATFDRRLWREMAEQLGLQGLVVGEAYGGSGFGWTELAFAMEELGRWLPPAPLFGTVVLAVSALECSGDNDAQAEFLPRLVSGELVATLAWTDAIDVKAKRSDTSVLLTGKKTRVIEGGVADLFLVSTNDADGESIWAVSRSAGGIEVRALDALDPSRPLAELSLDHTPARLVGEPGQGGRVLREVFARAKIALAAEQIGGAARALEIAVAHAKDREQFGRPIGSFQAVQHKCANVLAEVELARGAVWYAAWAADHAPDELAKVAPLAKAVCSQTYLMAAETCVHILGGIGFTWEHPAQIHFKRAMSSAQFLGTPTSALHELADATLQAEGSPPMTFSRAGQSDSAEALR